MRFGLLGAALLISLAGSSAVRAQEAALPPDEMEDVFARGCGDDRGVDRCARDVQARMYGLYGLESPADLLAKGVTVRRALFVDGYGNDVAAISFVRHPGRSPMVEVRSPRGEGGPNGPPLTAAVGPEAWATVLARSRNFDQLLARELPQESSGGGGLANLCLHAWFVVVEAVDAPHVSPNVLAGTGSEDEARDPSLPVEAPMEPGTVRADAESACGDGLAVGYAFALADAALASLPECGSLALDDFRTVAALLGQCQRLGGDRLVAGEASRTIAKLEHALQREQAQELEWLFVGIGETRAARFIAALDGGSLFLQAPMGLDADHAEVKGQVAYFGKNAGEATQVADISLKLLRQTGDFVIDTFEVSNRRPLPADR